MAKSRLKIRFRDLWEVDYRDDSGVRRRPVFDSEEVALAQAAEIRRALGVQRLDVPDRNITLAEYADRWLVAIAGDIELSTWRNYKERLRTHTCPRSGASGSGISGAATSSSC
jgi:hypothetical protein